MNALRIENCTSFTRNSFNMIINTQERDYVEDRLICVAFISASNGNCSSQFPEPRSGSTCRRTTIDYRCDQWCVWSKMWWSNKCWVVRCLSWKSISIPWFGRDYWHGSHADNSNKTANNTKYSNWKGLNHETYEVNLQNCNRSHFKFCLHFEFYFYPFSAYLQAKHDLFCA